MKYETFHFIYFIVPHILNSYLGSLNLSSFYLLNSIYHSWCILFNENIRLHRELVINDCVKFIYIFFAYISFVNSKNTIVAKQLLLINKLTSKMCSSWVSLSNFLWVVVITPENNKKYDLKWQVYIKRKLFSIIILQSTSKIVSI